MLVAEGKLRTMTVREIPVDAIDPSLVKLRSIDLSVLDEMEGSIKESGGFLQPILVRPKGKGRYQLVFGNHRLEAAKLLGLQTIPAVVKALNDIDATFASIAENVQRNINVDPVVEGEIFDDLCSKGWSPIEIARKLSKSLSYVMKRLDIYRNLHPKLQNRLSSRKMSIDMAHVISKHPVENQLSKAEWMQRIRNPLQVSDGRIELHSCHHCPIHCPKDSK